MEHAFHALVHNHAKVAFQSFGRVNLYNAAFYCVSGIGKAAKGDQAVQFLAQPLSGLKIVRLHIGRYPALLLYPVP
jgi:hypothetical protein